ncbi:hypothetical protein [Stenotrophomonas sp.]|uniref:hypothetical protein n=1 Tax=Stenotrophomonas sp. TaxID=69392 RepID=UPI0028AADEF6|nr:hypothetical protein [Stenotrophomonas sp.]
MLLTEAAKVEPLSPSPSSFASISLVGVLFFFSGAAALIYQVCWQRVLFAGMGADSISIAIIVSVFMLGLGFGGIMGGWVADRFPKALVLFVIIELLISIYGFLSVGILDVAMRSADLHSELVVMLVALLVTVIPTTLMGMTLPILVVCLDRVVENVGRVTGYLYCANTLGAALGAFLTGFYLFKFLDIERATWLAAVINLLVAGGGAVFIKGWRQ